MDSYRAAKRRLFTELLSPGGTAVLNTDSPEFAGLAALCRGRGLDVIRFGQEPGSELRIVERVPLPSGQRLSVEVFGARG